MSVFTLGRALAAVLLVCIGSAASAQAADPDAPCGRDENGLPYACSQDPSANLESSCLTSADPRYCLPYHQRACQVQGFAVACQMMSLGQNCQGGDPNLCSQYVSILQANRDCVLNGNPNACSYLHQLGF